MGRFSCTDGVSCQVLWFRTGSLQLQRCDVVLCDVKLMFANLILRPSTFLILDFYVYLIIKISVTCSSPPTGVFFKNLWHGCAVLKLFGHPLSGFFMKKDTLYQNFDQNVYPIMQKADSFSVQNSKWSYSWHMFLTYKVSKWVLVCLPNIYKFQHNVVESEKWGFPK